MHWYLERFTEPRSQSIYNRFRAPRTPELMHDLLNDSDLGLPLKFTAILAAFAYFSFPLQLADFRRLLPEPFWAEHVKFFYNLYGGGIGSTYCEAGETDFTMCLGPEFSPYGLHIVSFVAASLLLPQDSPGYGRFDPPLGTTISRYALSHPFLWSELHEPSGIYLHKS